MLAQGPPGGDGVPLGLAVDPALAAALEVPRRDPTRKLATGASPARRSVTSPPTQPCRVTVVSLLIKGSSPTRPLRGCRRSQPDREPTDRTRHTTTPGDELARSALWRPGGPPSPAATPWWHRPTGLRQRPGYLPEPEPITCRTHDRRWAPRAVRVRGCPYPPGFSDPFRRQTVGATPVPRTRASGSRQPSAGVDEA